MNCQSYNVITKGQSETKQIKIQFPQSSGMYPNEVPIFVHNTYGFYISAVDYNEETGLAIFNLLPSEQLFSAPVRFIVGAKYDDGNIASWRDFMAIQVIDDSQYIYTAPTLFKLKLESALIFDAFGMLNVEYRVSTANNILLDVYSVLAIFKELIGSASFNLLAYAGMNVTRGITPNNDIILDSNSQLSTNRGLINYNGIQLTNDAVIGVNRGILAFSNLNQDINAQINANRGIAKTSSLSFEANGILGATRGIITNANIMLEAMGQMSINRGLGGSGIMTLDAFANLSFTSITGLTGLITFHDVDASGTTTTQVNQTFTSANVDTGTGNINLNLGFTYTAPDIESAGVNRVGVPVYFSTTGTLPSLVGGGTLQPNTRYYAINNSTNTQLELYPECTENNRAGLIKYSPGETVLPQAFLYQGVKIMLSNGGTGTHTIFTNPLLNSIPNLVTSLPTPLEITDTNPNAKVEVLTDADGIKAVNFRGSLAKVTSATTGHGQTIGEKIDLSFGINKTVYRENYANKRYITMITVANVDDEPYFDNRKNIITPSNINAGTGVITYTSHGFAVGANGVTEVTIQPTTGSTLPPAMPNYNGATDTTRNTLWLRGISGGNTYTLHPTYADAKANTNIITYGGGTGSGEFIIGGYAQLVSKPEEHYFASIDFPIQWAVGSLNGKGAQRLINQTINTGNYQTSIFGPTNAEITGGLCSSVRGISNMFVTGQVARGLIQTTMPLRAYPIRLKMGKNAVYPFCTTLNRRLTEDDSFWGVPFPTGSSGRGWWFQTKAEADTWASRPSLTTAMNPDGTYTAGGVTPIGLVLDNSQYNFTTPSANNGFYGWGVWYLGVNENGKRVGLLGTSNVIPSHTITPLIELDKKVVFTTILDMYNLDTTAVKCCGVQVPSASINTTYTTTLNGVNRTFSTINDTTGTYTQNQVGTYSQTGTTVTVTRTAHGLSVGNSVVVISPSGTALGTFTVLTVPTTSTFTYTSSSSATGSGSITFNSRVVTVTAPSHGLVSGQTVVVTASTGGTVTGSFTITSVPDANTFVYTSSSPALATTGSITFNNATTTNVIDGLVAVINAQTATTGIMAGRHTTTMMHVWTTSLNSTFSLVSGTGLTTRPFLRYKILANGTEVTNGWEAYNNSDVRYAELLQSGNYVDSPTSDPLYAPCSHIIGSPAQPHVSFKGLMYAYLMACSNTDPTTQLTTETIPLLMSRYKIPA